MRDSGTGFGRATRDRNRGCTVFGILQPLRTLKDWLKKNHLDGKGGSEGQKKIRPRKRIRGPRLVVRGRWGGGNQATSRYFATENDQAEEGGKTREKKNREDEKAKMFKDAREGWMTLGLSSKLKKTLAGSCGRKRSPKKNGGKKGRKRTGKEGAKAQ